MKKILFTAFIIALMLPMISSSYALQEVAGPVNLSLKPGDKTSFNWGLISDSKNTTTVTLKVSGNGSQFLSYPSQVILLPQKIVYVVINASIPQDYYGKSTFSPFMVATEAGAQGGPTVLNIQVIKVVTLNIVGAPTTASATSAASTTTSSPSGAVVPEFPSVAAIIFVISIMLVLGVTVLSKQRSGLYKI